MDKHTPGPWKVKKLAEDNSQYRTDYSRQIYFPTVAYGDRCECPVALVFDYSGNEDGDPDANARLIAAAPEMLKFIERLSNAHSQQEIDILYNESEDFIAKIKE
jgi:hypothetical protein